MNRIGFLEIHRPKTPTERLEEIRARREAAEIIAVNNEITHFEEVEEYYEEEAKDGRRRGS